METATCIASKMPTLPAGWQAPQSPAGAYPSTQCLLGLRLASNCLQGYHKGMLGVNSATNFQQFQQLVSAKIPGLDPQQFNIVIVCSRAGAPEARQHIPIHENTVSASLPCSIHAEGGHHAVRQEAQGLGATRARWALLLVAETTSPADGQGIWGTTAHLPYIRTSWVQPHTARSLFSGALAEAADAVHDQRVELHHLVLENVLCEVHGGQIRQRSTCSGPSSKVLLSRRMASALAACQPDRSTRDGLTCPPWSHCPCRTSASS